MYRVTRKQKIVQNGNVIEFEESTEFATPQMARHTQSNTIDIELMLGARYYGPDKVIFESPTFYRSVTVTIEKVSDA
jgi:dTDP-4-amino-4,6-dideoxygalactose transaminase